MTIAVRISNDDVGETARTVVVRNIVFEKGKVGSREIQQQRIKPGQSAVFYIHALMDLHVEELLDPT